MSKNRFNYNCICRKVDISLLQCAAFYMFIQDMMQTDIISAGNPCDMPSPCDDVNGYCNIHHGEEECSCKRGYTLAADGSTCAETDECALGTDACEHNCTNTVGGYECDCADGYTLSSNGYGCDGRSIPGNPAERHNM